MKKTLNVVRYALVSLFSFVFIGSAVAGLGSTPKFGHTFNGSIVNIGSTDISTVKGITGTYVDGRDEGVQALQFTSGGATGNTTGCNPGTSTFTVCLIAKMPDLGSNRICLWAWGPSGNDMYGLFASGNTVSFGYGTTSVLSTTVDNITDFHTYVVTYNGGSIVLYVDGVQKATGSYGANTNRTAYGIFSVANGKSASEMSCVDSIGLTVQDWRFYTEVLSAADIKTYSGVKEEKCTATISDNSTWGDLTWNPSAPTATKVAELTVSADSTLTLDANSAFSSLKLSGSSNLTIVGIKGADAGKVDASTFTGNLTLEIDVTTGCTADDSLKDLIRSAPTTAKFIFKGSGSNGATLDFGNGNSTLNTHIVFDGGTHTFVYGQGATNRDFGANATADNPTVYLKSGTLTFKGKDLCGYQGTFNANGIIRADAGSTLKFDRNSGTFFYRQQLYLMPGATVNILNSDFYLQGGVDGSQIFVPASAIGSDPVTITGAIKLHHEATQGVGIEVGQNSTLKVATFDVAGNASNNKIIKKTGVGTLIITSASTIPNVEIAEGAFGLGEGATVANLKLDQATTIDVLSGSATITALTGDYAITKTGNGMLKLPSSYTNTVTINGDVDFDGSTLPFAWTLGTDSTGSIKLPSGFQFGKIVKASEIPAGLTFYDSDGETIVSSRFEIDGEGFLELKKTEINGQYDVTDSEPVDGDLVFGEKGSINITRAGVTLIATGTITLPEVGLSVLFSCDKEYVNGTAIPLITAANFLVGEADATIDDFKLPTMTLPKGMAGEFRLVDNSDTKSLVYAITKSDYYTEAVATILENASLVRRFDASRGVTVGDNDKVTAWVDLCGNAAAAPYSAGQVNDQPAYCVGDLREYIDFGVTGSGKDLRFERLTNAKTVIEVIDIETSGNAFLLGDNADYNFHRGSNGQYGANGNAKFSTVRDNGSVVENWSGTVIPTGFRVISLKLSQNCAADCFSSDRNGCNQGRTGGRKLSELLVFSAELTDDQFETIENYLTAKWNLNVTNTASIGGTVNWSDIWKSTPFYEGSPTKITLTGNTVLTYDAPAPVGNITFVNEGGYTLEQVVTSATELASALTISADETYTFKGGAVEGETVTFGNAITVNGILKTEGYVNLNANNTVPGGTLEVVNGQATLKFAGQGVSNGGTLTIDAGAKAVAASGDAFSYANNASFTLNVYGALNMGGNRWTFKGSDGALNIYGGAEITGTGDGNGALDMYVQICAAVNGDSKEATVAAPFKYSTDTTVDVGDGMTLKLTGAVKSNQTRTLTKTGAGTLEIGASQGNVTIAATAGVVVLNDASYVKSVSTSGTGNVEIAGGEYDVGYVRDFSALGNITTSGEGKIKVAATAADDGTLTIVNVPAGMAVAVYDADGTTPLVFDYKEGTITATCSIKVDGAACYYDWTFTNSVQTTGAKTLATSAYSKNQGTLQGDLDTSYADQNEDGLYTSLYTSVRPWANLNWSTVGRPWTIALAGKMSEYPNTVFISLGGANKTFFFSTTDTPNEVRLVYGTNQNNCEEITVMSVPAASTLVHVYEITLSADGKDLTVYLDGLEWASSHKEEGFEMINGIQVSGWYNGNYFSSGYKRDGDNGQQDNDKVGRIKMLRIYNSILGPNAMAKLSEEFPYNPQFGAYSRTLDEATEDWSATEAWTDDDSQPTDVPVDGSVANLTVGVNSELTINVGEEIHQESISIVGQNNEGQELRIKAGSGEIVNDGATVITTPVTIEYGAMTIAGGPTKINGNGSVTFDFSEYPIDTVIDVAYGEGRLGLTGLCDAPASNDKTTWPVKLIVPDDLKGRKMTIEYTGNNKYELVYGIDRVATTLYLTADTTLGDDTLFATSAEGTADTLRLFAEDVIVVPSGKTLTINPTTTLAIPLTTPIKGAGTISATGFTLKDTTPLFALDSTWTGTVEFTYLTMAGDSAGSTWFDLNRYGNANSKVTLTGVAGFMKTNTEFLPEVTLKNNNLAGLNINNGSSSAPIIFSKVKGDGNLIANETGNTAAQKLAIGDASELVGQIWMRQNKGVTLGSTTSAAANNQILVADGATITFASQTWNAGSISFAGALNVIGELGSTIAVGVEPTALPTSVTLVGEEGDYTLAYDNGNLMVANAEVAVAIPEIAGTDVVVTVEGVEEPIGVIEGYAAIPYGADMTVTYTAQPGRLFKDETEELELTFYGVTEDPNIEEEIEGEETVEISAEIDGAEFAMVQNALDTAAKATDSAKTVKLLRDVEEDVAFTMVAKNVILDLNGFALVGNISATAPESSTLVFTIKNPVGEDYEGGVVNGDITMTNGKLTISRNSTLDTIVVGSIILNNVVDASIQGTVYQEDPSKAAITVNGASSLLKITNVANISATGTAIDAKAGTVKILSNSSTSTSVIEGAIVAADGVDLVVTGGTFTTDPSDIVSYGYVAIEQDTDPVTWKVVKMVLPTATQTPATVEGCEVGVTYGLGTEAVGYDDWNVDFEVSSDVALGSDEFTLKGSNPLDGETMVEFPAFELAKDTPVKLLATFASQFKVTYAQLIAATQTYTCGVVNNVKQEANVTVKIVLSKEGKEDIVVDGSEFNTTLKAKAIEPVVPGEDIDIPDDKDPEEYAGEVEAQKATLLKAPVELTGEALTTYQGYFTAQVVGDNKVAFVLNTDGENAVKAEVKAVEADVLSVALSADAELTIADPLKGFYYSLKQGGELTGLVFNDAGDKNKLGGKVEIKFTLTKPEGKGFYQTIVTPVEYK